MCGCGNGNRQSMSNLFFNLIIADGLFSSCEGKLTEYAKQLNLVDFNWNQHYEKDGMWSQLKLLEIGCSFKKYMGK